MSSRVVSPAAYCGILAALVLLTTLTIAVSFVSLTGFWHTTLGLTIGVCKASLVGLFFMHLIDSPRTTWAVVVVAIFWLIVVLMALVFVDYMTRLHFPSMPGH